ncbi:hypothetical protein V494_08070 [Pseudogymnoascus sp. VKM F-4513 (FW-928)]|nr:hypothetical protein V494_08070 [Pseudogymnoascus sp. VKM F-4513 (FW-928)]
MGTGPHPIASECIVTVKKHSTTVHAINTTAVIGEVKPEDMALVEIHPDSLENIPEHERVKLPYPSPMILGVELEREDLESERDALAVTVKEIDTEKNALAAALNKWQKETREKESRYDELKWQGRTVLIGAGFKGGGGWWVVGVSGGGGGGSSENRAAVTAARCSGKDN